MTTGNNALRAETIGGNPEIARVVSNAVNVVRDLQGLVALQEHLARVSERASSDVQLIGSSNGLALANLCKDMRELVCSYVYSHDKDLSTMSASPYAQVYQKPGYEKDPAVLLDAVDNPLTIPAFPGNLFYLACKDNPEIYNPVLYNLFQTIKTNNPSKSDSEIISDLIPRYVLPGLTTGSEAAHPELLQRWTTLENLTAVNNWTLDNDDISVITEADEVIAIAGLRTILNYKIFTGIRYLDSLLDRININDAKIVVSYYAQLNVTPQHYGAWLSQLKLRCNGRSNISDMLMNYLANKFNTEDLQDIWEWIATTPVVSVIPQELENLISILPKTLEAQNLSINYIYPTSGSGKYTELINSFTGISLETIFLNWKTLLEQRGGILGFEAFALIASLTALDRVRKAAELNLADSVIEKYAAEGYRLSGYVSNAQVLQDAFEALRDVA